MALDWAIVKVIVSPVVGHSLKRATPLLLGKRDERELQALCSRALGDALDEALDLDEPLEPGERDHLVWLLEEGLRHATSARADGTEFGPSGLATLIEGAHASGLLDWSTFGLFRDEEFYRLDEVAIYEDFLSDLAISLHQAAKRSDSALANLSVQLGMEELSDRIRALSAATDTAPDAEAARKRALDWQRGVVAARKRSDPKPLPYIDVGLTERWRTWRERRDWSAQVIEALESVSKGLEGVDDEFVRAVEVEIAKATETTITYSALHLTLMELPLDAMTPAMPPGDTARQRQPRNKALKSLQWLKGQRDRPHFNQTFNLAGSFGSGVSRFLTTAAEAITESGDLFVFIRIPAGRSVFDQVSKEIFASCGIAISDIREAKVLLEGPEQRRLYLLLDDLDQQVSNEDVLLELQGLIEDSTAVPGIRWCLGANLDGLDSVLSASQPYFWEWHGYAPSGEEDHRGDSLRGWIDVDTLNAGTAVGLRVLEQLAHDEKADLGTMIRHRETFASEAVTFATPLSARIRHEAMLRGNPHRAVSDPHDPDFIRQYWQHLKDYHVAQGPITRSQVAEATLEFAVTHLARRLSSSPRPSAPLFEAGQPEDASTSPDSEGITALRRMALVQIRSEGDPEVEPIVLAAVPVFAPFWGYRIGRLFEADFREAARNDSPRPALPLEPWFARANLGEPLAEAVCQFTLGGLAQEGTDIGLRVWKAWEKDKTAPRVPLLMAGTSAPEEFRRVAVQLVTRRRYEPLSKRETFMMMRLVAREPSAMWKADGRLVLFRDNRRAIVSYGLHTYATYLTEKILQTGGRVQRDNFVNTCMALMGCDETDTAELAARLVVNNGKRVFQSSQQQAKYLMKFLRRISKSVGDPQDRQSGRASRPPVRNKVVDSAGWISDRTFPRRLIDAFLAEVLSGRTAADEVRMLATAGFWSGESQGIDEDIEFYMGQQLNLAYGRTAHRGLDDSYIEIVHDLMSGAVLEHSSSEKRHTIAMYLIKHSVPTYGRWEVRVPEKLHPALRVLCGDPSLLPRQERERLSLLCRANNM